MKTRLRILAVMAIGCSALMAQSGEALYKQRCAGCHGSDGKAETTMGKSMHIPSFASPDVQKESDADLTNIIEKGKGRMPAYKTLKPDEVQSLVAYIRTLGKS